MRRACGGLIPRAELVDVDVPDADVLELEDAGRDERVLQDELARLLLAHVLEQRVRAGVVRVGPAHHEDPALDQVVDERRVLLPAGLLFAWPALPRRPGPPADDDPNDLRARH